MERASLTEAALVFFLGVFLVFAVGAIRKISALYLTPIRHLQGPPTDSFLFGNFLPVPVRIKQYHQWVEEYGKNFVLRGPLQVPILFATDLRTISYILTHSNDYQKPEGARKNLSRVIGQGVLVTEGERHRVQRRVMNPAFGPTQVRELSPIFVEKANELCAYWKKQISAQDGSVRTNVMEGLSKMTLDVIGIAGFNYHFEAMNTERPMDPLNEAFTDILRQPRDGTPPFIPVDLLPIISFVTGNKLMKKIEAARGVMRTMATQILEDKKAEIMRAAAEKGSRQVEKDNVQGRDLLTLLIKANMVADVPESQRMTDEEVLWQIPTFMVGGHETTSTATTWCLFSLCNTPRVQQKLREEVLSLDTDTPSMDQLEALPYLDKVIRETLRLHPPVAVTVRAAMKDDVMPVSGSYMDRFAKTRDGLHVSKGTGIMIPIYALHTSRAIWGDDVWEFRPERWGKPPEAIAGIPGVWGHLLTFLGGPHACIGYRFSLAEMKAIIFTLLRTFEFELAVPNDDIHSIGGGGIKRPYVRSESEKGPQMPLIIRPYTRD